MSPELRERLESRELRDLLEMMVPQSWESLVHLDCLEFLDLRETPEIRELPVTLALKVNLLFVVGLFLELRMSLIN